MISYKVLIALIVTYNIICYCCGGVTKMELNECSDILYGVGFSCYSGLVDYCFVKQFLMNAESEYKSLNQNENTQSKDDYDNTNVDASFNEFKTFMGDQYKEKILHDIVKEFFKYNANITADSRLKTPKEFCSDLTKTPIEDCDVCEVCEVCEGEILTTDVEEILKINDGSTRSKEPIETIEYGEDKYNNLIKTNILRSQDEHYRNDIIKKLPDGVFQDYRTWCEKTKGYTNPL